MQKFRVDIILQPFDQPTDLAEFARVVLSVYGFPTIVSYDATGCTEGDLRMVLEFPSYDDALEFAQDWYGESDVAKFVKTVTP